MAKNSGQDHGVLLGRVFFNTSARLSTMALKHNQVRTRLAPPTRLLPQDTGISHLVTMVTSQLACLLPPILPVVPFTVAKVIILNISLLLTPLFKTSSAFSSPSREKPNYHRDLQDLKSAGPATSLRHPGTFPSSLPAPHNSLSPSRCSLGSSLVPRLLGSGDGNLDLSGGYR